MKKRAKVLLITACVLGLCLCGAYLFMGQQSRKSQMILHLTPEQKLADFDALCQILDESYPFWLDVAQADVDKDSVYAQYRTNIPKAETDIAFFKEISYFLKEFQGFGHLSALDGALYGLYLDTLTEGDALLSPQEKARVAPLLEVLQKPVSQQTYSLLDRSHRGFRSTIGLKEKYEQSALPAAQSAAPEIEAALLNEQTAYLKIDSFELTNYQRDGEKLAGFFEEMAAVPNLIVDLRDNGGGSDLYWQDLLVKPNAKEALSSERIFLCNQSPLLEPYLSALGVEAQEMETLPEALRARYQGAFSHYVTDVERVEAAPKPYGGRIWLLVDESVYSAAENFVMFCKNTGFATLVGTPTGGDGGMVDPLLVALPNSGLIVRFSAFYGLNADGSGNEAQGTSPDVLLSEGQDALQICLEQIASPRQGGGGSFS